MAHPFVVMLKPAVAMSAQPNEIALRIAVFAVAGGGEDYQENERKHQKNG